MQRKPIYQFDLSTDTGLHELPQGSIVTCLQTSNGTTQYQLVNKTNITETTTIAQAITNGNLKVSGIPNYVSEQELAHLDGLTANIQSQLNGKSPTTHNHTVGSLQDAAVLNPAENDILSYDSATGKWVNQTAAQAGLAIQKGTSTQYGGAKFSLSGTTLTITTN